MALLTIRNLCVHYGAIQALHGVDLEVQEGQIVALLGSNGAGKTTTLRAISGLLKPSAGDIVFDGQSMVGLPPELIVKRGIAHVPEGRGIFSNLTVEENLRLGAYIRTDTAAVAADREWVFELFPRLQERLGQNAGTLSGGEQRMLSMARALLSRPRLLLLDEPSLGLAPQLVQAIFATIRRISQDPARRTTILLVEQNAHMALATAAYGYILATGQIKTHAPAGELANSDEVRKAYLGVV